jgi:hypothetical protein
LSPIVSAAIVVLTDRENGRLVHLSLDGQLLGVAAENLLRPAAVAIRRTSSPYPNCAGASRCSTKPAQSSRSSAPIRSPTM